MKKLICALLVLLMLSASALAEGDWYLDTARELTKKVGEVVRDEEYQQLMTSRSFDCVTAIRDADFARVHRVYRMSIDFKELLRAAALFGGEEINEIAEGLSEAGWMRMESMAPSTVMSMYNNSKSSEELAASTILRYSRTYEMPEDFGPCVYILEAGGAIVGVSFAKAGEETVQVTAQPLFAEAGEGIRDVIQMLEESDFPCNFEQVR